MGRKPEAEPEIIEIDFEEGTNTWDVTEAVLALDEFNDDLKDDPNAPAWVREHSGPFEIHVEVAE